MRGKVMALLLMLGFVSAVSSTVVAVTTVGWGASACAVDSSSDEEGAPAVLHNAILKRHTRRPFR